MALKGMRQDSESRSGSYGKRCFPNDSIPEKTGGGLRRREMDRVAVFVKRAHLWEWDWSKCFADMKKL